MYMCRSLESEEEEKKNQLLLERLKCFQSNDPECLRKACHSILSFSRNIQKMMNEGKSSLSLISVAQEVREESSAHFHRAERSKIEEIAQHLDSLSHYLSYKADTKQNVSEFFADFYSSPEEAMINFLKEENISYLDEQSRLLQTHLQKKRADSLEGNALLSLPTCISQDYHASELNRKESLLNILHALEVFRKSKSSYQSSFLRRREIRDKKQSKLQIDTSNAKRIARGVQRFMGFQCFYTKALHKLNKRSVSLRKEVDRAEKLIKTQSMLTITKMHLKSESYIQISEAYHAQYLDKLLDQIFAKKTKRKNLRRDLLDIQEASARQADNFIDEFAALPQSD